MLEQAIAANQGAREVYLAAGMENYAPVFDNLELEIRMADLLAIIDEKKKELEAQAGEATKPAP